MNIDWNLAGAIFSSSVVAAFLTKALDLYTSKLNYKRDYFKRVIDERLIVYGKLNEFLSSTTINLNDEDQLPYNIVFRDRASAGKLMRDLNAIACSKMWLSNLAEKYIFELLDIVMDAFEINNLMPTDSDLKVRAVGKAIATRFELSRRKLEMQSTIDYLQLSDVTVFLKQRKSALEIHQRTNPIKL